MLFAISLSDKMNIVEMKRSIVAGKVIELDRKGWGYMRIAKELDMRLDRVITIITLHRDSIVVSRRKQRRLWRNTLEFME